MATKSTNTECAVHNSALFKKKKYTKWKCRWFALYDSRKLVYYEDYVSFTKNIVIGEIDLTEVTKLSDINNKQIDKQYSFELVTPSRTYILGYKDRETLNIWIKVLSPLIFGITIYSGWLIKSGENMKNRSWKKRFFVLSNLQEIRYYKDDKPCKSKGMGTIKLTNVIRIGHGDNQTYTKYPYSIEIITCSRVWVLAANNDKTREIWMEKLTETMNPFINIKHNKKKESESEVDLEMQNKFDGYFEKMDKILASYYWSLGRCDYYNDTNHGKFMLFVTQNDCVEQDINDQLGDDAKSNQCEYVRMDDDFPLYPKTLKQHQQSAIFDVLQYCFKHQKPPKIESEWKAKLNILNEGVNHDIYANMRCESIANCKSLNRLIVILDFYQKNMNKIEENNDILLQCFEDYPNFLKDYGHILSVHLNENTELNDAHFLMIYNTINRFIKCDFSDCQQYKRNNDDTLYPKLLKRDKNVQFYINTLDSIHCFFIHSYHSGFRIKRFIKSSSMRPIPRRTPFKSSISISTKRKTSSRLLKQQNRQSFYRRKTKDKGYNDTAFQMKPIDFQSMDDINIKFYDDNEMIELQSYLQRKRRNIESNRRERSKFNNDIRITNKEQKVSDTDKIEYNFGEKCYFWDYFKDNNKMDNIYNPSYRYKQWYIDKKWSNLREEILNNQTCTIDIDTYNAAIIKAQMFLEKSEIKNLKCKNADKFWCDRNYADPFYYKIPDDTAIDIQHIMSIILYTDTTKLSYYFSKSFRKLSINEPTFRFKKRKSEYWNWSKLINETVNLYGIEMKDRKSETFYTGISTQVIFNEFIAFFNCPTSTTSELAVATRFASENGCILELTQSRGAGGCLKFFNCSFVSKYGYESEKLFVGGWSALRIMDIRSINDKHDYKEYIKAISLFNLAINGEVIDKEESDNDDNDDKAISALTYQILSSLINSLNGLETDIPIYIENTFKRFVDCKERIKISLYNMNHHYPLLSNWFIVPLTNSSNDNNNNLPSFDYLSCKLFIHCKHIIVDMLGAYCYISKDFLSELAVMIIDKINNITKLEKITLEKINTHQVEDELSIFQSRINSIGWHYMLIDNDDVVFCQNILISKNPLKNKKLKPNIPSSTTTTTDEDEEKSKIIKIKKEKQKEKQIVSIHRNHKNILGYFVTQHSQKLLTMEQQQKDEKKNDDKIRDEIDKIVSNPLTENHEYNENIDSEIEKLELLHKRVASIDAKLKHHRVRSDINNAILLNKNAIFDQDDDDTDKLKEEILSSIVVLTETLREIQQIHDNDDNHLNIVGFLESIDNNMNDLILATEHVRVCADNDNDYNLLIYFIESYYKLIQPIVIDQLLVQNVPISQRLFAISWIRKFKDDINRLEHDILKCSNYCINNRNFIDNLNDQQDILTTYYCEYIQLTIKKRINKIIEKEMRKQEYFMVNDCPNVHCTQTLLSTLDHQFRISMEKLKGKEFVKIIHITLQSMDQFKILWKQYIDTNWREQFEDEYICGILNSSNNVKNKLNEKYNKILTSINEYDINDEQQNLLKQVFDSKICIFSNLSNECSIKLSQRIYDDTLKENIFDFLFNDEYFKDDDDDMILSMILTLKEYFGDFKVWIQESTLFWQVVTSTMVRITNEYLISFIKKKPQIHIKTLAKHIEDDIDALNNYFGKDDDLSFSKMLWNIKYQYLTAVVSALRCQQQDFKIYANVLRNNQEYGNPLIAYIETQRKKYMVDPIFLND